MIAGEKPDSIPAVEPEIKINRASRNKSIEGLRGFSACIVIVAHVYAMSTKPDAGFIHPFSHRVPDLLFRNFGYFGVFLFFFISGYLIVQSLIKHANIGEFLKNRAVRIYPVFLILQLIIFTLGPIFHYQWMGTLNHHPLLFVGNFISNLLFLPGIFPLPIAQKNAWTLSYEFLFYLTACVFYYGYTVRRRSPAKGYAIILAGLAITSAAIFFNDFAMFFLVGVFVYFFYDLLNELIDYGKLRDISGYLLLAATYELMLVWLPKSSGGYGARLITPSLLIAGTLLFFSVVKEEGLFSKLLRTPAFQHLGKISYSLYLIHPFVFDPLRAVIGKLQNHLHNPALLLVLFAVIGFVVSVTIATYSYQFIEVKLTRFLFGKRPKLGGQEPAV